VTYAAKRHQRLAQGVSREAALDISPGRKPWVRNESIGMQAPRGAAGTLALPPLRGLLAKKQHLSRAYALG
jgi:hypothetical protein